MAEHHPGIGVVLYNLRQERGWSLREAARRADVAFSRLAEWEHERDNYSGRPLRPSFDALCRLARIYGADRFELLRLAGYDVGLTQEELQFVDDLRALPKDKQARLRELLDRLKQEEALD